MKQIAYLGMDVHKNSITLALITKKSKTEEFTKKIENNITILTKLVKKLYKQYHLRVCYEAGGCGFTIYRKLTDIGIDCIVVAPSLIPEIKKGLKTDKIDAIKLASLLKADMLTSINVPDEDLERDRDLIRFRESQVNNLRRSKQSICAFVLRKGLQYDGKKSFTKKYLLWLSNLELEKNDKRTLQMLLNHFHYQQRLVDELEEEIVELSKSEVYKRRVEILIGFRGIRVLNAMKILTNIADFRAFPNPKKLMSFFGVTADEKSSGEKQYNKGISKRGNSLLRKSVVLAAQSFAKPFNDSVDIRKRRENLSSSVLEIVQRADKRCKKRYYHFINKGKNTNVAKMAVARELVGFIWEAMMYHYEGELIKV
ncbi:MAG: IS110 family transposase [Spirochaetota bacterium]